VEGVEEPKAKSRLSVLILELDDKNLTPFCTKEAQSQDCEARTKLIPEQGRANNFVCRKKFIVALNIINFELDEYSVTSETTLSILSTG